MEFKAKDRKKRLQPGVHLVTIKDIYIARQTSTQMPISFTDPKTGEEYGAIEIVFMDHTQTGIIEKFLTGTRQIWVLNKLLTAINCLPPAGQQIEKEKILGRKVWIAVARCMVYENQIVRVDKETGLPMWYPMLLPDFFSADLPKPTLRGNPQDNDGVPSHEFVRHYDAKLGLFEPTPNYISDSNLPREGFGQPR